MLGEGWPIAVIAAELHIGRTKNEVKSQLTVDSINKFLMTYETKILTKYIIVHFKCLLSKYKVKDVIMLIINVKNVKNFFIPKI